MEKRGGSLTETKILINSKAQWALKHENLSRVEELKNFQKAGKICFILDSLRHREETQTEVEWKRE